MLEVRFFYLTLYPMKNQSKRRRFIQKVGFLSTAVLFLSLGSFNTYSQTTNPPSTITPPTNQVPRTPPETQPTPSQTYPGSKYMSKDTVIHLKKDTSHVKQDTVKKTPPPRKF